MKIIHHSFRRSFEIVKGSMLIAKVNFLRWYSMHAAARIPAGLIEFTPQNFWKSSFLIEQNGQEIGNLKLNWKSKVTLTIKWSEEASVQTYRLRKRSFFNFYYELTDEDDQPVAILRTQVNWRQFSAETRIEYIQPVSEEREVELLMCCGYAITVLRSKKKSAG